MLTFDFIPGFDKIKMQSYIPILGYFSTNNSNIQLFVSIVVRRQVQHSLSLTLSLLFSC
jgi:hypothetical protein